MANDHTDDSNLADHDLELDTAAIAAAQAEEDRRRAERLALNAEVTLQSETIFFTGLTENLSEGGLFVSTLSPPPIGELVHLKVTAEGGIEVEVRGHVRWHRRDADGSWTGCGIQFHELDPRAARVFSNLMAKLRREPLLYEV